MAVIALNSPKGGVAKTTTAILLASELALVHNYRVALLDADLNQHSAAFAAKASIPGLSVIGDVTEANVLAILRDAEARNDVVFVDLPGATSTLNLKALQRSHFVILPSGASLPDVRDAFKGLAQIEDAAELARAPIARSVLWTRVLSGFESRAARHVRESVEEKGIPLFSTVLFERAAYRELHMTCRVPRQSAPNGAAAENIASLANELLTKLQTLTEEAA